MTGVLTDPRTLGPAPQISLPSHFSVNDNLIIPPAENGSSVEVIRGPNIKPFPVNQAIAGDIAGKVLITVGDDITTDHIMPSNAKRLSFRVPIYRPLRHHDPDFRRAKAGVIHRCRSQLWAGSAAARGLGTVLESGGVGQSLPESAGKFDQQWHLPLQFKNRPITITLVAHELIIENTEAQLIWLPVPLAVPIAPSIYSCSSDLFRQADPRRWLVGVPAREQTD